MYLTGESGVGAGVISDGRPLRGARGYAGEIGHLPLAGSDLACRCGRKGCVEAVVGIPALIRQLNPEVDHDGPILDFEPEVARIAERAGAQDRVVLAALQQAGRELGNAAATLANLLNPEVIVLGGYYVQLAPWLLPAAEVELSARVVAPSAGGCRLATSTLGHGAAALGGTAKILDSVDAGQLPRWRAEPAKRSTRRFAPACAAGAGGSCGAPLPNLSLDEVSDSVRRCHCLRAVTPA